MSIQDATTHERRIVSLMLEDAVSVKGWTVSINDGEAWPVKKTQDVSVILDALCTTDADTVRFRTLDGDKVGDVMLVWGNDEDVISDHSDNDEMNAFLDGRY